ncbi:hypothetical protein A6J65_013435 [Yersinia enterocolitica]|nr:hypothetical protein A6J65_013435 [Yersinia enterocolitica]
MAAIPERYFQEKTLGLLGASIYGAARAIRDDFTASLRSACFHRYGHFVINLNCINTVPPRPDNSSHSGLGSNAKYQYLMSGH